MKLVFICLSFASFGLAGSVRRLSYQVNVICGFYTSANVVALCFQSVRPSVCPSVREFRTNIVGKISKVIVDEI